MMKYIYILLALLSLMCVDAFGQQDPLFTQYQINPVSVNPAIAGVRRASTLQLNYRQQWVGIDGAPVTSTLSYQNSLSSEKVGVGGVLIYDKLGPVVQTGGYLQYSYHLILDNDFTKFLSMGFMGGGNYYSYDLTQLDYGDPDNVIDLYGYDSKFLWNFGFGLFYYTDKFYFGASIPKLLRNSLSSANTDLGVADSEEWHLYLTSGYQFKISDGIDLTPTVIARMVNGARVSGDLNLTMVLQDKFWIGAGYRWKTAWNAMIRCQLTEQLHIGYSYDYSITELKTTSGRNANSHELSIGFDFKKKNVSSIRRYF